MWKDRGDIMAYTINANAKNVWIRDNEDTRDLSIQTDASSVYLDNGRTLEQELGEGSMVSNVATVDTSMSKVIDGTLDGAYESLVFKGKSLVNVAQPFDRGITDVWATIHLRHSLLKQSTKYYYQVFDLPSGFQHVFTNSDGSTFLGTYTTNNISTFTTNLELTSDRIVLHINDGGKNALTQEQLGKIKVMVIEYQQGMENWDIPYFTGLCDVKMPILRNTGKNLFDGNLEDGALDRSGMPVEYENRKRTGFIKIKQGETYTISGCTIARWCFYTPEKRFITTNTTQTTKPAPMDGYIRFSIQTNFTHDNIQLEESSSATSYEDHKTNILHTPETVTLRSLPSGVCDELNLKTGEYIKRIGEIVLDGSEDWAVNGDKKTVASYICNGYIGTNNDISVLCDKFPTYGKNIEKELIRLGSSGRIIVHILKSKIGISDSTIVVNGGSASQFKTWLQSNPITVQYELATPIVTTIEPLSIPFAYENGHIVLESGYEGQSLLPTLEYSTVVNRIGQVESVAKVIQKQEKQLTMLEQMLIQNIIELDYNNTVLALNLEINEVM